MANNEYIDKLFNIIKLIEEIDALERDPATVNMDSGRKMSTIRTSAKTGYDGTRVDYIDESLIQLVMLEKEKVLKYFQSRIDNIKYLTEEDHKKLREFIINWYTANKSLITQAKNITDFYSLSGSLLDILIQSFGFPYPKKLIGTANKVRFLLDLITLYKKKGTPIALLSVLTYFGLQDIRISEWWLHVRSEIAPEEFLFKSKTIIPRGLTDTVTLSFSEFLSDDPLWQQTSDEIGHLYQTQAISLPSLTPYLSITSSIDILQYAQALALVNKKLKESYSYWYKYRTLNRDMFCGLLGLDVSFLEVSLAVAYLLNGPFVESMLRIPPEGTLVDGVQYLIAQDAYRDWWGKDRQIAKWQASTSSWLFIIPTAGMPVYVKDQKRRYIYISNDWVPDGAAANDGELVTLYQYKNEIDYVTGWVEVPREGNNYTVISRVAEPPATVSDGDAFIITENEHEIWGEYVNKIVRWRTISGWIAYDPNEADVAYVQDVNKFYRFYDRDNIDDQEEYKRANEYFNLYRTRKPVVPVYKGGHWCSSRQLKVEQYGNFRDTFTHDNSDFFLKKREDIETYLGVINPELKAKLDEQIRLGTLSDTLTEMFNLFDSYLMDYMEVLDFPLSLLLNGASVYQNLKDVINFFKPLRARMHSFMTIFAIDDPLADSVQVADCFTLGFNELFVDKGPFSLDNGLTNDDVMITSFSTDKDYVVGRGILEYGMKDEMNLITNNISYDRHTCKEDQLTRITISETFVEGSPSINWDEGLTSDSVNILILEASHTPDFYNNFPLTYPGVDTVSYPGFVAWNFDTTETQSSDIPNDHPLHWDPYTETMSFGYPAIDEVELEDYYETYI